jgi:hypothetical protein
VTQTTSSSSPTKTTKQQQLSQTKINNTSDINLSLPRISIVVIWQQVRTQAQKKKGKRDFLGTAWEQKLIFHP